MEFLLILLLVVVVVVVGGAITVVTVRAVQRRRYIRSITDRGWTFTDDPELWDVAMLHLPPFGRQFHRTSDELTRGRTSRGPWFQAFDYTTTEFDNRILTIRLPHALPELHVIADQRPRPGVNAPPIAGYPVPVYSPDADYARHLLTPAVMDALLAYGRQFPLDVSVDGDHLVAVSAPTDPEELSRAAELLAAVALAVDPQVAERWPTATPMRAVTFHAHPDWSYVGVNDHLLHTVQMTGGGMNHRTAEVVTGNNDGLPFVALEHHWQTQTTSTHTDANGNTSTTTHTHNHVEYLVEFALAFASPPLYISYDHQPAIAQWLRGLSEIDFESAAFNRQFDIRCGSTRFAYDVIHPRQMEYLTATQPPPFVWGDGRARFRLNRYDEDAIGWICDFFRGFIERVPGFVWQDLQAPPPVGVIAPVNR